METQKIQVDLRKKGKSKVEVSLHIDVFPDLWEAGHCAVSAHLASLIKRGEILDMEIDSTEKKDGGVVETWRVRMDGGREIVPDRWFTAEYSAVS